MKNHPAYKHGLSRHPLYSIWNLMISRCKENNPIWIKRNYYDRGISVCNEWKDLTSFFDWALNNGYKQGLTLDRINNDKGYCPGNCRFTTMKIQAFNRNVPSKNPFPTHGMAFTIRNKRRELCVSQIELSNKIRINPSLMSAFETGKTGISTKTLDKILNALSIDIIP